MNKLFFSVIIPTYNRAYMLTKALNSVRQQSFKQWECIIVDDGSTDNTRQVVNSLVEQDARFKYIYQENAERSAARNNGIKNAKGDYICFLDSDDYYLDNHLSILYKNIKDNYFPIAMFYVKNNIITKREYNIYETILKTIIHSQHVCIHKEILMKYKFNNNINIGEDIDLWMHIADEYEIFNINKETVVVVEHDNRSVNFFQTNSFKKGLTVFRSLYKDKRWNGKISSYVKRTTISDCYFGISKYHIYQGNKFKAFVNLLYSIFVYPNRQFKHKIYTLFSLSLIFTKFFNLNNEYKKSII